MAIKTRKIKTCFLKNSILLIPNLFVVLASRVNLKAPPCLLLEAWKIMRWIDHLIRFKIVNESWNTMQIDTTYQTKQNKTKEQSIALFSILNPYQFQFNRLLITKYKQINAYINTTIQSQEKYYTIKNNQQINKSTLSNGKHQTSIFNRFKFQNFYSKFQFLFKVFYLPNFGSCIYFVYLFKVPQKGDPVPWRYQLVSENLVCHQHSNPVFVPLLYGVEWGQSWSRQLHDKSSTSLIHLRTHKRNLVFYLTNLITKILISHQKRGLPGEVVKAPCPVVYTFSSSFFQKTGPSTFVHQFEGTRGSLRSSIPVIKFQKKSR